VASLDQLETFLAVYRTGSLTTAAGALHISQPSVSAHLRALETELGAPLFVRGPRGVEPTERGITLAHAVAEPIDALVAVKRSLAAGMVEETVVVGGPIDLLALRLLPALASVLEAGLRLRVRTGQAEQLVGLVARGELDLAIASRQPHHAEVVYEPLGSEVMVLVGAPVWAKRLGTALESDPPAALADVPWLALSDDLPIIDEYCEAAFGWRPTAATAAAVLGDLRAIAAGCVAGVGVTVAPRYLVAAELADGSLVQLHSPEQPPTRSIALAYRPGAVRRAGTASVHEAIRVAAAGWGEPGPEPPSR
jgi:DNA-binding transcriptional LysR family regulator